MADPSAPAWPYDARQDDPLTARRLAVVASPYPAWYYLISVCVDVDLPHAGFDSPLWGGVHPDEREVELLLSELEYEREWYNAGYLAKMAQRPFDIDGGFNSLTFLKYTHGGWSYRRRTWEFGPHLVPTRDDTPAPLVEVLNRVHGHQGDDGWQEPERWTAWKAVRPELFGEAVASHG